MLKKISAQELKHRIEFLRRNLLRGELVTEEELDSVTSRFKGLRGKDALWEEWAHLKAFAIARTKVRKGRVDANSLEVAIKALSDKSVEVGLPSIDKTVRVYPASWLRIQAVEEHDWWVNRLIAARGVLLMNANMGIRDEASSKEVCSKCGKPSQPGNLGGLLKRIRKEMAHQRNMLFANVIADGPAPVEDPVEWGSKLTAAEEVALKEAYHRVNYGVIRGLPSPQTEKGENLPDSWAFLFSSLEEREKKPAIHFMRDRSLGSLIASIVLKAIRDQAHLKSMENQRKKA